MMCPVVYKTARLDLLVMRARAQSFLCRSAVGTVRLQSLIHSQTNTALVFLLSNRGVLLSCFVFVFRGVTRVSVHDTIITPVSEFEEDVNRATENDQLAMKCWLFNLPAGVAAGICSATLQHRPLLNGQMDGQERSQCCWRRRPRRLSSLACILLAVLMLIGSRKLTISSLIPMALVDLLFLWSGFFLFVYISFDLLVIS